MEETNDYEVLFEMPVEFDLAKSEDSGKRCVKGYASTEDLDKDKEQVLKSGMDYQPLKEDGFINYDHQRRMIGGVKVPLIIGYPTNVEMKERGLWCEGELLKGDAMASEQIRLSNEMWELGCALQKSGSRRLAYSMEGAVLERRGKKIVKSVARHVALTHKPVNSACTVEVFAKSLCCGKCSPHHPGYNPAHSCGNKHHEFADGLPHLTFALQKALETTNSGPMTAERTSPLMRENLDRGLTTVLYGEGFCPSCFDQATGKFHKGLPGAVNHMQSCLGHGKDETYRLLKRLLQGSEKNAELAGLVRAAGLIR